MCTVLKKSLHGICVHTAKQHLLWLRADYASYAAVITVSYVCSFGVLRCYHAHRIQLG